MIKIKKQFTLTQRLFDGPCPWERSHTIFFLIFRGLSQLKTASKGSQHNNLIHYEAVQRSTTKKGSGGIITVRVCQYLYTIALVLFADYGRTTHDHIVVSALNRPVWARKTCLAICAENN